MRRARVAMWAILPLTAGVQLAGQEIVAPGSPAVQPPAWEEAKVSFELVLLSGAEERTTAGVTRSLSSETWNGESALLLVQQYRTPDGIPTDTDSSWVAAADLSPLAYRAQVGEEEQAFTFSADGAHGSITSPDSSRTVFDPEAVRAFNSVTEDLVIGNLPLGEGFAATIRLYNPGRGATTVDVFVEGEDEIPVRDGLGRAWRVRYAAGAQTAAAQSWFWFDVGTRQLIRSRTVLPNGSEFWRVRTADLAAWRGARSESSGAA